MKASQCLRTQACGLCKRIGPHDRQVLCLDSSAPPPRLLVGHRPFSGFHGRRKPEKVQMQNLTQPFVKLSTANAELITRFAQSPEMVELANTSAQKYFDLAQKNFGHAAASEAHADLVRRLTENYATFAQEYSASLMGIAADAQSVVSKQAKEASERIAQAGQATVAAAVKVSDKWKQPRA
jgi:hypothetical protein